MKVTLYCLGEKAYTSLVSLEPKLLEGIELLVVGKDPHLSHDFSNEIMAWAEINAIRYCERRETYKVGIKATDYHIAIGWRWLINIPHPQKLIVFHDSILPKYRGFNPLVTALLNGDSIIGVTALYGSERYDEGEIIGQRCMEVMYPIKIGRAISKISELYSLLLSDVLKSINNGTKLRSKVQNSNEVSYSLWRDDEDYFIDWSLDAEYIVRFIDAVGDPYKGACTTLDNEKIIICEAETVPDLYISNRTPGKAINKEGNCPIIVCGKGLLKIKEAKLLTGEIIEFKKFRIRFK